MDKTKMNLKIAPQATKKSDLILTTEWNSKKDGKKRVVMLTGDLNTGMVVGIKYYGFAGDFKK
jgi:hypothetical protein